MAPNSYEIIDMNASNVTQHGFFCYMSASKAPGYQQKQAWIGQRFAEGLKLKILHEHGGRDTAFIEYTTGEYAWRAVSAPGYMVIHCLWVVGKGKGKGFGKALLEACLEDAHAQGKQGVVMVTSDGTWLAHKPFFLHNGFVEVDQAPPSFQLLVHRFNGGPDPAFPHDWTARQAAFGSGLTVVRTAQCPYIQAASASIFESADRLGIPAQQVELHTAQDVQARSPSPYGVFNLVYNGRLLSCTGMKQTELEKRLAARD